MTIRRLAAVLLILGFVVPAGERLALADDPRRAAELFKAGERAYAERRFREAAVAFEEANQRAPRAATIYAAAVSWHEAGEAARAADAFELALADGRLDADAQADGRARLARLVPTLATVEVEGPPGARVSVAHASGALVPARIHLAPGEHELKRVDRQDMPSMKLVVAAGETTRVAVPSAAAPPQPHSSSSSARTGGWFGIGATGVFAASAVVFGLATLNARDEFVASGETDAHARDRALTFRTVTNIAWVGAAIAGATGITLLAIAPRSRSPVHVRVGAASIGCSVPLF